MPSLEPMRCVRVCGACVRAWCVRVWCVRVWCVRVWCVVRACVVRACVRAWYLMEKYETRGWPESQSGIVTPTILKKSYT
jgi:hypothetical protein